MLVSAASFAALAVAVIGILVFWSNPHRIINRFFLSFSLQLTSWLICVHRGVSLGEDPFWVRLASAIGVFAPWHMWLIKEACIGRTPRDIFRRSFGWLCSIIALVLLCYTDWYVRLAPGGGARFGPGYVIYMLVVITMYAFVCRQTILQIRSEGGVSRMELQILLLGGCAMCLSLIFLMALRGILHDIWPIHVQPVVVLVFYAGTVVAITTHRIFNARQLILLGIQKMILVGAAAAIAFSVEWLLEAVELPKLLAWFFTIAAALSVAAVLNRSLERLLQFYPQGIAARQAAFAAAREMRLENLEQAFHNVLKGWGQSEYAMVLSAAKTELAGAAVAPLGDTILRSTIQHLRWATPERLARERPTPGRERVAQYMKQKGLGVVVISEGPTLVALIGVGPSATRLPYTYPQVMQLLELASIMEGALERVHFSTKAQHAEQLATVGLLGASVAHEIRNPLVTIKTFVQLLPAHYQDTHFREKFFRLIGDEVDRIDRLTEQLLDLASPRTYSATAVELHAVLRATIDLAATKAAHKNVQLVTDFAATPDTVHTDAAAAKQVMLNLCFNAIQALDGKEDGPRCVWVGTRNTGAAVEVAVTDSGPGIAPEILPRLFQPFQTTKSSGFGLGLAICSDILANLNANITVDQPVPGQGATFRVTFPCRPSLS